MSSSRLPAITFAWLLALVCLAPASYAVDVFLADAQTTLPTATPPANTLPVLFIHGHPPNTASTTQHFKATYIDPLAPLTSFGETLADAANAALGIEPYFLHFTVHDRSIVDDVTEIAQAVDLILQRHDPGYVPNDPDHRPNVKVVIVAYSKGTISTRLYLKSLVEDASTDFPGLPTYIDGYQPVSEFIALAPPNHGLRPALSPLSQQLFPPDQPVRELHNGHDRDCASYGNASADFIEKLNGHPIEDSQSAADIAAAGAAVLANEAPGSRSDGDPIEDGVLYVAIYAGDLAPGDPGDFVGGDAPVGGCQGRRLARNLAADAVNLPIPNVPTVPPVDLGLLEPFIPDDVETRLAIHQNTVHFDKVICLALYTAVHHRAPALSLDCGGGDIPIVPGPARAATVLALDASGSMLLPACAGCTQSRLDVLKEAAELFVRLWSLVGAPEDRIGVAYFRTDVSTYPPVSLAGAPPVPPLTLLAGEADNVIQDIAQQMTTPWDLTAMGGGLESAVRALQTSADQRHVLLFTDGMQNVFPKVLGANGQLEITGTGSPSSNITASNPATRLDAALGIQVDVIGVGAGQNFVGPLTDIAAATGGIPKFTTAPDADLRSYFIEDVISALRGFSPQLVDYRRDRLGADGATEIFDISSEVIKLVIKLSWHGAKPLDFKVHKGNVDVTGRGHVVQGRFYRFFVIDLPASMGGVPVDAGGEWRVAIGGESGRRYEIAAVVDGSVLGYDFALNRIGYSVGDVLELNARLALGERVVEDAQITATVLGPKQSAASLIAANVDRLSRIKLPGEPGLGREQRLLNALLLDEELSKALRPLPIATVRLRPTQGGRYQGISPVIQVPGAYTVVFDMRVKDEKLGSFHRRETHSTFVGIDDIDPVSTRPWLQTIKVGPHVSLVAFKFKPRDIYGNHLGAGAAATIDLRLSAGKVAPTVADDGDGSYTILAEIPKGTDPKLALRVGATVVYSGALSELLH